MIKFLGFRQPLKGKHLICNIKGTDLYKRIAICKLDGLDINQYMVEQGYAVAYTKYSDKYEIDAEYAINNNKGIWQVDFKEPEEFRKEQKLKKSKKAKANNPQIKTLYKSSSKTAPKKNSNNKQKTKNKHAPRKKVKDNSKIKITTWNVNSIRKRIESIKVFIKDFSPDILALQETKVSNDLFPVHILNELGYSFAHYNGETTGYNGVAILAKNDLQILPKLTFIKEARHLTVRIEDDIELHNFYIPAGGDIPDPDVNDKFKHKLELLDQLIPWFKTNKSTNDKIILMGDLNIAPLENDVWSHKQLLKIVSHKPIEVEKLDKLLNCLNFKDAIRKFTPDSEKLYSWWSYKARDWQKSDKGRILDHIWVTEPLHNSVVQAEISKYTRDLEMPSDHGL